ncbi:MAG: hypothetical protein P4N59_00525 [Negativicutes bacterium]|nr:hypothetical protein [Negativicutes bacterium]
MLTKKLVCAVMMVLLFLYTFPAFATSRLIQPYENPQGIYEDEEVRIQLDLGSNFSLLLSVTNKTSGPMKITFDRASVLYAGRLSSEVRDLENKASRTVPANGYSEFRLEASTLAGMQLPLGPGFAVKLWLPVKVSGQDKTYVLLFEKARPVAQAGSIQAPSPSDISQKPLQTTETKLTAEPAQPQVARDVGQNSQTGFLADKRKDTDAATAAKTGPNIQTVEIGVNKFHRHYQEDAPDYETGWMNGMRLSYKNQNQETKQYWRIFYETTNHKDAYIGSLQDNSGNYMGAYNTTTKNKLTTKEIIFANPINETKSVYAYIGIGSHSWDRDVLGSGTIADSVEKYSWKYVPLGYRHEFKIDDKWDGAIDFALRFMFNGQMKAPNPGNIDPFQVRLGHRVGFKFELPYIYHMNSQWSMVVAPWYEYWEIGESNWVRQTINGVPQVDSHGRALYVVEPSSKTNQLGINVGLQYVF